MLKAQWIPFLHNSLVPSKLRDCEKHGTHRLILTQQMPKRRIIVSLFLTSRKCGCYHHQSSTSSDHRCCSDKIMTYICLNLKILKTFVSQWIHVLSMFQTLFWIRTFSTTRKMTFSASDWVGEAWLAHYYLQLRFYIHTLSLLSFSCYNSHEPGGLKQQLAPGHTLSWISGFGHITTNNQQWGWHFRSCFFAHMCWQQEA